MTYWEVQLFTLNFCIKTRHLVKPWPHENFYKCSIFFYIWATINYFIIIMRNKILIFLIASTCANFLDLVNPKTCPWVFCRSIEYLFARNLWIFRDEVIAAKCEGQCDLAYVECTSACSTSNCLMECGRALINCTEGWRFDCSNAFYDFDKEYSVVYILFFKIVHVMSTVQMVVMVARIRFVSAVRIRRLRMKIIYNNAKRKKVLIWANASLIAKTINPVSNLVLMCSKSDMTSVLVR